MTTKNTFRLALALLLVLSLLLIASCGGEGETPNTDGSNNGETEAPNTDGSNNGDTEVPDKNEDDKNTGENNDDNDGNNSVDNETNETPGDENGNLGEDVDDVYTEGLQFTLMDDDTYSVTGYNGSSNDVIVPSVYEGKAVTRIGKDAFKQSSLMSIAIGNKIKSIGNHAFAWCHSLKNVIIGNSVESIGESAFESCSKLTSIIIPNSVESIGESAFYACSSLVSVTIGNSVGSIGSSAFDYCYKLVEVINHSLLNLTVRSRDYGMVAFFAFEIHTEKSKIIDKNDYLFYTYDGVNYLVGYVGSDANPSLPENYNDENYVILEHL